MVTIVNITTRMDVWVCIRQDDSAKARKNLVFHDKVLMAAAEEVMQGIWEADLGSGVIKKRLPLQQGKSGGARTIIFFKSANHVTGAATAAVLVAKSEQLLDREVYDQKKSEDGLSGAAAVGESAR